MDETELEDWFNTSKEQLEEAFYKKLLDLKNPEQKAKEKTRFDKAYRKLIRRYQKKQNSLYQRQMLETKIKKPIMQWKTNITLQIDEMKQWITIKKDAFKKWLFDIKFRRTILK